MLRNYSFFIIFIHSDVTAHFNPLPEPFILFGTRQPKRCCVIFRSIPLSLTLPLISILWSFSKHRMVPLYLGRRSGGLGTLLRNRQMLKVCLLRRQKLLIMLGLEEFWRLNKVFCGGCCNNDEVYWKGLWQVPFYRKVAWVLVLHWWFVHE